MSPAVVRPANEVLVEWLAASTNETWTALMDCFHRTIQLSVIRVARGYGSLGMAEIDDAVQAVYLKLGVLRESGRIHFQPSHEHAAQQWVRVVASNLARDILRARSAHHTQSLSHIDPEDPSVARPGEDPQASIERQVLLRSVEEALDAADVSPRDRDVFWLYYREGLTSAAIAALPQVGLTVKGVESLLQRTGRIVREHIFRATKGKPPGGSL